MLWCLCGVVYNDRSTKIGMFLCFIYLRLKETIAIYRLAWQSYEIFLDKKYVRLLGDLITTIMKKYFVNILIKANWINYLMQANNYQMLKLN